MVTIALLVGHMFCIKNELLVVMSDLSQLLQTGETSDLSQLLQRRYTKEGGGEDRPKSGPQTRSCDLSQAGTHERPKSAPAKALHGGGWVRGPT